LWRHSSHRSFSDYFKISYLFISAQSSIVTMRPATLYWLAAPHTTPRRAGCNVTETAAAYHSAFPKPQQHFNHIKSVCQQQWADVFDPAQPALQCGPPPAHPRPTGSTMWGGRPPWRQRWTHRHRIVSLEKYCFFYCRFHIFFSSSRRGYNPWSGNGGEEGGGERETELEGEGQLYMNHIFLTRAIGLQPAIGLNETDQLDWLLFTHTHDKKQQKHKKWQRSS